MGTETAELAPDIAHRRLAAMAGSVRGIILVAGIAHPINDVIIEQVQQSK